MYTREELMLDTFGTKRDQQLYLSELLLSRFPEVGNRAFPATGRALKTHSFNQVLEAILSVTDVTPASVFAKLNYYLAASSRTESCSRCLDDQTADIATNQKISESVNKQREVAQALKDVEGTLVNLAVDGLISTDELQMGLKDTAKAEEIIRRVMLGGSY